ncbi:primase-helicase zinc-binding domain-containing protein [uncultured Pelagimonas sp.]|uniref:DUF7146 domain-containing protein n=1 Tax=uncultured Pelagimonas sp. TaxID=1618102 RepID=UPI002603E92C|nr:primase-helicase zinc-binding domain-containing protein [uncultured Pelagimonas sp.]
MINPTAEKARGHWHGILPQLGINADYLKNKHGPCPMCGGKERFRFDNKNGSGTFYCNQCGPGDAFKLLQEYHGWTFKDAAKEVDRIIGHDPSPERQIVDPEEERRRQEKRDMWRASWPSRERDYSAAYLASRGLTLPEMGLRTHPSLRGLDGNFYPTMLGVVSDPDGNVVTMHRTFLNPRKPGKAETETQRALLPGNLPDGCAIRLSDHGDVLGVAEGIETAQRAAALFQVPVWSTINTSVMKKFITPPNVRKLMIFGDNDLNFAGHYAAFELANKAMNRARRNGIDDFEVDVQMAPEPGSDWADF